MLGRLLSIIIFLLTQLFFQINVHSEVYRWIDEDGKVVYGDKPATNNAAKIKIKKTPEQDNDYQKRQQKQQRLLEVMQEERIEKTALKKEEKEKKKKQQQECAELKKELQETKDASVLYEETDDPDNPRFLSDEERKTEEDKYEKYIKENC